MDIEIIGVGTTKEQNKSLADAIETRTGVKPVVNGEREIQVKIHWKDEPAINAWWSTFCIGEWTECDLDENEDDSHIFFYIRSTGQLDAMIAEGADTVEDFIVLEYEKETA